MAHDGGSYIGYKERGYGNPRQKPPHPVPPLKGGWRNYAYIDEDSYPYSYQRKTDECRPYRPPLHQMAVRQIYP